MKYYLIVGEASGDLHASHLMAALKAEDPQADFRFFGGDLMAAVGGTMVKHYKELAYMGSTGRTEEYGLYRVAKRRLQKRCSGCKKYGSE